MNRSPRPESRRAAGDLSGTNSAPAGVGVAFPDDITRAHLPDQPKLTALDERSERVLSSHYSDNDVTLLGGETRHLEIECPAASHRCERLALGGWSARPQEITLTP